MYLQRYQRIIYKDIKECIIYVQKKVCLRAFKNIMSTKNKSFHSIV